MKYKSGDKVVIKPWRLMAEQYGLTSYGNIACGINVLPAMEECIANNNRVMVISRISETGNIDFKGCRFTYPEECILDYAFDIGEEIEVSDSGINWDKATFFGYRINSVYRIAADGPDNMGYYMLARPVSPIVEMTVEQVSKELGYEVKIVKS